MVFVSLITGAAFTAVGGYWSANAEPPWVLHVSKFATCVIPAGTIIDKSMVGDYIHYGLPDALVVDAINMPKAVANPVGLRTIIAVEKGQIFTENCVQQKTDSK